MNYMKTMDEETRSISFIAFRILFAVLWMQYTVLAFLKPVISGFPVIGVFAPYVLPTMIVVFLCLSFPYIIKKIRPVDVLFYFTGFLVVVLTMTFCYQNAEFIKKELFRVLISTLPFYFAGVAYNHDKMKEDLYKISLITVILMFVFQVLYLSKNSDAEYNMDMAYKTLPSVMYLVYWAIENKRIKDWAVVFLGIVLELAFGTRGAVLAIIIYIFVGVFLNFISSKNAVKKILFFIVFALVVYLFLGTNLLLSISMRLTGIFESLGFSTRIFDHMISGEIGKSDERGIFADIIMEKIAENPVLGYGIFSDRVFIGVYVHNILLEVWCDFGFVFGTLLLGWFAYVPTRVYTLTKRRDIKNFILSFICMVFVKLMLSGSYLNEINLYLMLGLGAGFIRNIKAGKIE